MGVENAIAELQAIENDPAQKKALAEIRKQQIEGQMKISKARMVTKPMSEKRFLLLSRYLKSDLVYVIQEIADLQEMIDSVSGHSVEESLPDEERINLEKIKKEKIMTHVRTAGIETPFRKGQTTSTRRRLASHDPSPGRRLLARHRLVNPYRDSPVLLRLLGEIRQANLRAQRP